MNENLTYEVIFSDGNKIENLTMNGNNFVSKTEITEDMFTSFKHIVIKDSNDNEQIIEYGKLLQIVHYSDGWYFIIVELSPVEIAVDNLEAQALFTALMTDTVLEE